MNPQALENANTFSAEDVRAQLKRVVASAAFRNSQRLSRFLQFLVERWLAGTSHELKERIVGTEVFGRPARYDLSSDPVVRVAAGDMRKRLAQYYMQEGAGDEIRFDLPRGSYALQISRPHLVVSQPGEFPPSQLSSAAAAPLSPDSYPASMGPQQSGFSAGPLVHGFMRLWKWVAAIALPLAAIGAACLYWSNSRARQFDVFWAPVWSSGSTLICVGDLNFLMKPEDPTDSMPLDQRMRTRDHVGPNDALALSRISGLLGSREKSFSVSLADEADLTQMRAQPAVLIGASDNWWTGRTLEQRRFQIKFDAASRLGAIVDARHPEKHDWTISYASTLAGIHRDYALISRLSDPLTGQVELVVAGVGPYGTAAGSEFVTRPGYFQEFTRRAPRGWESKNIQIVLSTDVVNGRSGPPQVEFIDVE